jgi:hypothetical protein
MAKRPTKKQDAKPKTINCPAPELAPSIPAVADYKPYVVTRPATGYLYRGSLKQFLADLDAGDLVPLLQRQFRELESREVAPGELTAWNVSLPAMADVLRGDRFQSAEVFVEVRMPLCGRRCDVLLTGRSSVGKPSAVVVELKQWQSVGKSAIPEDVAIGTSSRQHPSAQVRDYVRFLAHYHSAFVDGGLEVHGCAYLHDMTHAPSIGHLRDTIIFGSLLTDYPLFVKHEFARLGDWLFSHLGGGDGTVAADAVAQGSVRPSEKLLDVVVDAIHGNFEWKLLDQQRRAFMIIRTAVEIARGSGEKCVVIVRGGPGTGKSVLAIQLLAHAADKHWRVVHSTGSQAFQVNLQARTMEFAAKLMKKVYGVQFKNALPVQDLFCTFADVARLSTTDCLDLVVADEAHRLWEFRRNKWAGMMKILSTTPMAEEMIRASRVTAFFLDDNQAVRAGEIGRSSVLRDHALRLGVKVHEVDLDLQFRCNGSESYVRWVDGLLGFGDRLDLAWRRYGGYDLYLDANMPQLVDRLEALRAAKQRCRLVAGYCWRWSDPKGSTLVHDVTDSRFGGWSGPWIERTEQDLVPTAHRYFRWATDEACADQVGSIYSAQGFEFDHVGVIMGEDLVWRKDRWVADPTKNFDKVFKQDLRKCGEDPVEKLRSVYRVLLTRGMRGTSLFVLDAETREHVARCLEAADIAAAG